MDVFKILFICVISNIKKPAAFCLLVYAESENKSTTGYLSKLDIDRITTPISLKS